MEIRMEMNLCDCKMISCDKVIVGSRKDTRSGKWSVIMSISASLLIGLNRAMLPFKIGTAEVLKS